MLSQPILQGCGHKDFSARCENRHHAGVEQIAFSQSQRLAVALRELHFHCGVVDAQQLWGDSPAAVLVHVVNPQSFHWTMDLSLPWPRLLLLCMAVVLAGTLTAWLSSLPAAGRGAVLAVKEDW